MPRNICQMAIKKRIMTAKVIGYMKPDIDPNTRLYVPFNEGVGDLAKDYSQYCNHAQLTDVEWSPDGGKFNGSSSIGDCGNDSSLDVIVDFTIGLRFYPTSWSDNLYPALISKRDHITVMDWQFYYYQAKSDIRFAFGNNKVTEVFDALNVNPSINKWHHLAVRKSGNNFSLFHDNVYIGTEVDATAIPTGDSVRIGSLGGDALVYPLKGTISSVLIRSLAKNSAQIAADCYEVVCS